MDREDQGLGIVPINQIDEPEAESQEPVPEVDMTEADVTEAHADPKHYRNKRQGNSSKRGIWIVRTKVQESYR